MTAWRTLVSLAAVVSVAAAARAQSYHLTEAPLVDSYFRVELDMALSGEIKVQQEGKVITLKQTARAEHGFLERILEAGNTGLVNKSARYYRTARADIAMDKNRLQRAFRNERRLLVAHRVKDQAVVYCPNGPLTREELELTEHFDTLGLPGLLPGREVSVGEKWKLANAAVQSLCDLDGLIGHDLSGKLDKVDGNVAHIALAGTANGISLGAAVKMTVAASCRFDLKSRRLTAVDWKQTEQREQGPVSPAFSAVVNTKMKRTAIEPANELNDFALVPVPPGPVPPESMTKLFYADPQVRYELVHARDWHLVSRSDQQQVLRLMERGEFVAQLTITPWKKADPGKHLSEDEFKDVMSHIPGWEQEEVLDKVGAVEDFRHKYWIRKIGGAGTLNGTKAVQYLYLVAGPQGDQVVMTFTMAPAQSQKLNTRDLDIVHSLTFPASKEAP